MEMFEYYKEIVKDENGEVTSKDQKLICTGIDSFGVIMVLNELDSKYPYLGDSKLESLDFDTLTFNDLSKMYNEYN
jgi:hypothetical protein